MSNNILGSITFGPCKESIKFKNRFVAEHEIDEEFGERPDYINPQFSDERKFQRMPKPSIKSGTMKPKSNALDRQVGGSHYKNYKIQPYEFFIANQIPHHKAAIIRRILRYDHTTGKGLEDLKKIQHEVELIIQLEKWEDNSGAATVKKEG